MLGGFPDGFREQGANTEIPAFARNDGILGVGHTGEEIAVGDGERYDPGKGGSG
jgi:hypothetical protein